MMKLWLLATPWLTIYINQCKPRLFIHCYRVLPKCQRPSTIIESTIFQSPMRWPELQWRKNRLDFHACVIMCLRCTKLVFPFEANHVDRMSFHFNLRHARVPWVPWALTFPAFVQYMRAVRHALLSTGHHNLSVAWAGFNSDTRKRNDGDKMR